MGTRPLIDVAATTMEGVMSKKLKICAHPVIEADLERGWPDAKFVFDDSGNEYDGLLDLYEKEECQALAISWEGGAVRMDAELRGRLCENDLIFTTSLIIELPIAFPIRPQLAHKFSSWMINLERVDGITIEKMVDEDNGQQLGRRLKGNGGKSANAATPTTTGEMSKCNVEQVELTRDEYARIDINQMAFPFIFFTMCTVLAIILQLVMVCQGDMQNGREHWVRNVLGRRSTLDLMESMRILAAAQAIEQASRDEMEHIQDESGVHIEVSQAPERDLRTIREK